jgi:predicted ABC-type ATPase
MEHTVPQIYLIGGPNGAGKTTSVKTLLPGLLECHEFVNADAISTALSPFTPEETAISAGRLMLERIHSLAEQKKDFAFETTLASRTFVPFLRQCKQLDYQINLIFFWLQSPRMAIARVTDRVRKGGQHIPDDIVLRRYSRSMHNFLNLYTNLADDWTLYDNSFDEPILIAKKKMNGNISILDKSIWKQFTGYAHE